MIEEAARGPPHGILLAIVVILVVSAPALLGDWEAITESFSDLISPTGLLLLPIILLLVIRFLSSDRSNFFHTIFTASGEPESIHRASGSPFGVALVLAIVLFLVYYRTSMFGGGGGDDDDE